MQSFRGSIRLVQRHYFTAKTSSLAKGFISSKSTGYPFERLPHEFASRSEQVKFCSQTESLTSVNYYGRSTGAGMFQPFASRCITTMGNSVASASQDSSAAVSDVAPRIKFKRLDKTARHIMQILDKEAVEDVKGQREIPDIRPGYIVQLKVEVPENKRRVSILKGIVIARRNAGLNTTFRLRRLVAGVGVENLFLLYSPNIKEIKVLDKKNVRRAKLYYLRDRMNPLKK
ncbi:50S ribosomal protein L19, chloroplastic-like [Pistacia vera]|uniref:50S ribosomal protein L19, chloroplastic-like n=1 Tax=Pistacia vera TaxID=55513 RepID=UPI001262CC81|nr:50S ribosomal protein L19, chloroplastic-like [Pistacia vera]